jgi:tetratricopeptide (TPR) repeat protein
MRTALSLKYAGTRVSVVERSQLTPLMEELELDRAGLTAASLTTTAKGSQAQPAFVVVDGLYQAFRDEQSKINLVLRMEWVGGRKAAVMLKELPGPPLVAKASEAIDRFLGESPGGMPTNSATRKAESLVQIRKGRDLARISGEFFIPPEHAVGWSVLGAEREPRVREAIATFESALFLDPESIQAKFCLAGCLADPIIGELEKARDYWREIAATSTIKRVLFAARLALAHSYIEPDALQAYELIRALRTTTTNILEQASLNHKLTMLLSFLGNAQRVTPTQILEQATDAWRTECVVAEERLASRGSVDVNQTFILPMSIYSFGFSGRNSTQLRREYVGMVVSNLVQEFPKLEPYLVHNYVRIESNWSPFWKEWHQRILTTCSDHPEAIPDPPTFYTQCLVGLLQDYVAANDFESADALAKLFEKRGRAQIKIQLQRDELDFLIGHIRLKLRRWDEALKAFEQIGSRQVRTPKDELWGKGGFLSGTRAAEICRQLMPRAQTAPGVLLGPPAPSISHLPSPQTVKIFRGEEVTFAIDRGDLWLADRIGFYHSHLPSDEFEPVPMKANPRVRRVLIYREKVWMATADGLYSFDPASRSVATNSVADGLLLPSVTALAADDDKIWVGFGDNRNGVGIGGMGYLNLAANRFVGLMPELPANLAGGLNKARGPASPGEDAPKSYMTGIAKGSSGSVWATTSSRLLRYSPMGWETVVSISGAIVGNVVANDEFVVVPCYEPSGWSSMNTNFGGVVIYDIRHKTHRRLLSTDGFPNNKLHSALIDGSKCWLGGEGFLAMVDLPSARLEKICALSSTLRIRSMAISGNDLWFASGPGLYRLPKNAEPEAGQPTPKSTGPEITDIRSARELLKQRQEVRRVQGTAESAEYKELTARYYAFVRRAARDLPWLDPARVTGTNGFLLRTLNQEQRGYDGFRFRNTLAVPADFGWIFAYEQPSGFSWWIVPVEDTPIAGFIDYLPPKIAYTNAPWTSFRPPWPVVLQFLHDGQLAPGKEYIIWIDFGESRPTRFFVAFDLFPASERNRSRTVLEGTFGLSGPPLKDRF